MSLSSVHLFWTAGFLEGEGCFYINPRNANICVCASQVQRDPLARLCDMFGGSLTLRSGRPFHSGAGPAGQPQWFWSLSGKRAAALMMTIFPIMSPRRHTKIAYCIALWSKRAGAADLVAEYADPIPNLPALLRIAWAAGFLEGEGNFHPNKRGSIVVRASQVQKAPLSRLQSCFGGSLIFNSNNHRLIWQSQIGAMEAAELMMSIFPLMSPQRQAKIAECMALWKTRWLKKPNHGEFCTKGHLIDADNTYTDASTGYRRCRRCCLQRERDARAAGKR